MSKDMQKVSKWWRVPIALSFVLGFVPAMYAMLGAFYGLSDQFARGLGALCIVLAVIWMPALIALGIRRLRAR